MHNAQGAPGVCVNTAPDAINFCTSGLLPIAGLAVASFELDFWGRVKNLDEAGRANFLASDYARQAFFITLLNPKAIVFYMAFFPLFIDPATHRGLPTFAAMALTIAVITAVYCLTLCAFANAVAEKVRAHRQAARWLERAAGVFLIGFGIRLVRD